MILSLDHVAIAVPELPEAVQRFAEDLGLPLQGTEDVHAAQTRTAFLPVAAAKAPQPVPAPRIELVTPLEGQGPLVRHLDRRGPGLHHLAFRTDDIDGDMARLKDRGYRFTTPEPTEGAHHTRVAFLHPKDMGGVLIELVEYPSHG